MSDAWFNDEVEGEACNPGEEQVLKDYLRDRIDTNEATRLITSRVADSNKPYELLTSYWGLLQDVLTDIPTARSKVIKLLQAIQQSPPADLPKKDDNSLAAMGPEIHWSELPGFVNLWADSTKWQDWRQDSGLDTSRHDNERQQLIPEEDQAATARLQGQAWRNAKYREIATIEAQLVANRINAMPLEWGYQTICNALEDSKALLEMEVPAAKEWLSVAGKQIHGFDLERPPALGNHRDLWKGSEKMSKERWEFWKQRLDSIQGQDVGETMETAREALAAINAVEGQQ